jgi:hypothetical protein
MVESVTVRRYPPTPCPTASFSFSSYDGTVALSDPVIIGQQDLSSAGADGHQMPDSACLTGFVPIPDRKIRGAMIM